MAENVVGETGFEPATLCSQSQQEAPVSADDGVKHAPIPPNGIKGLPGPCKTEAGQEASPAAAEQHHLFTVDSTAYLRNLDDEDRRAECIAIHYGDPPRPGSTLGTIIYSLRFPALIITGYVANQREIAEKVARILNAHWDDPEAAHG